MFSKSKKSDAQETVYISINFLSKLLFSKFWGVLCFSRTIWISLPSEDKFSLSFVQMEFFLGFFHMKCHFINQFNHFISIYEMKVNTLQLNSLGIDHRDWISKILNDQIRNSICNEPFWQRLDLCRRLKKAFKLPSRDLV